MARVVRHNRSRLIGLCAFAAVIVSLWRVRYNDFTLLEWWRDLHSGVVLSRSNTSDRVVALTFDDGPDPRNTGRILDILNHYHIHATFFEEGRMIDIFPDITRRVAAEGNCIGNHTYSHPYLTRLSPALVDSEVSGGAASLARAANLHTGLFRPPRGDWNPTIYNEAVRQHLHIVLWSVSMEHHDVVGPKAMADRVLNLVKPGSIILMHDGGISRDSTVEALPLVIEGLVKRGYKCITVPELLHVEGDTHPLSNRSTSQCAKRPRAIRQLTNSRRQSQFLKAR